MGEQAESVIPSVNMASIRMDLSALQAPNGMVWEYLIRMVR